MPTPITERPLFKKTMSILIFTGFILGFNLLSKIAGGLIAGLGKFFTIYILGKWFGDTIQEIYALTYLYSFIIFLIAIAIYVAARKSQYIDGDRIPDWDRDKYTFMIESSIIYTVITIVPMIYFLAVPDRLVRGQYINAALPLVYSPQLFIYYLVKNPIIGYLLNLAAYLAFSNFLFYRKIKTQQ